MERNEGGRRTAPKRRRSQKQKRPRRWLLAIPIALLGVGVLLFAQWQSTRIDTDNPDVQALARLRLPEWVTRDILPEEADSRGGELLEELGGIAIHYVGNPGSTAAQNRSYFGNAGTEVNAHFVVGLEGEIIQCLPLYEKSAATNERNRDTISIEVCHPDEGGEFSPVTYASLVRLVAFLCDETALEPTDMLRHYDVTGKMCPLYYVEHPDAWTQMIADVESATTRED